MPTRPKRPCGEAGCSALVEQGRCPEHATAHERGRRQSETWRKVKGARGGQVDIYTTSRWREARARFLARHPLCVTCEREGRVEAASAVDHRIPHRGDMRLFWDASNWDALCATHHSRKTAGETIHADAGRR
jgi:5-methylcytosine-specific restriction enzyme A